MSKKPLVLAANADSHRQFKEIELTDPRLSSVSGGASLSKGGGGGKYCTDPKTKKEIWDYDA